MAIESKYYEILEVETDASDHEIKRVQLTPHSFTVKNE
jgi:curved DNA-binding protein CbpA